MFDEINVDGKWYDVFLDLQQMRLYTRDSIESGEYKDKKENMLFKISDMYIVCIDFESRYLEEGLGRVVYYDIIYYIRFDEISEEKFLRIDSIIYYSKTLENYMIPLCFTSDKETSIEKRKIINLKFEEKNIKVEFYRKNYIKKQSFYNTNMDSYIRVSFENEECFDNIYKMCTIIEKYLKFSVYLNTINQPKILIYNENYSDNIGEIVINSRFYNENELIDKIGFFDGSNEKNSEKIFKFFIDNPQTNLNHLPNKEHRINYQPNEFSLLYSAFEFESNKVYKEKKEDEEKVTIKTKISEYAKSLDEYNKNKDFIDGLIKNRIKSYGKEYSHRIKIRKAFDDYLKIIPKRTKFYGLNENSKQIINKIYDLRTHIIHDNLYKDFSTKENLYIHYFEWLIHVMLLCRIGIKPEDIEEIMDGIFWVG